MGVELLIDLDPGVKLLIDFGPRGLSRRLKITFSGARTSPIRQVTQKLIFGAKMSAQGAILDPQLGPGGPQKFAFLGKNLQKKGEEIWSGRPYGKKSKFESEFDTKMGGLEYQKPEKTSGK